MADDALPRRVHQETPLCLGRRHESGDRVVKPADQPCHLEQRAVMVQSLTVRVMTFFTFDEAEHLTTLVVDAADSRCAVEADVLQMAEQAVNCRRPRAGLTSYGLADPRHRSSPGCR